MSLENKTFYLNISPQLNKWAIILPPLRLGPTSYVGDYYPKNKEIDFLFYDQNIYNLHYYLCIINYYLCTYIHIMHT